MRILFVGVFENNFRSTNTSQLLCFKRLGHDVVGYNYRQKQYEIGAQERDEHLVRTTQEGNFDLVVYSKCNNVSFDSFKKINNMVTTCLWFMDPLISYDQEMRTKTSLVDYFCCDKLNVLEEAKMINSNSYHVPEGYDSMNDYPHEIEKERQVVFIGNVYGERKEMISKIVSPVDIISNAFGKKHAIEVSKSKISLNFCTSHGASDRIYKTLAAKGFLLTDDWEGREAIFDNNKHLVIFKNIDDLNEKIEFYLANPTYANEIAENGYKAVQQYTRNKWAQRVVEIYDDIK